MQLLNQSGRCLIGHNEGLRLESYLDGVNVWTIGWGTTQINGRPVTEGMKITREQAVEYFNTDVAKFETIIRKNVTVPITNNQFAALVSFVFNIGASAFKKSTLLKKLNQGDYDGAANEFGRWIYAKGKVLNGLITRREQERDLFLTPD